MKSKLQKKKDNSRSGYWRKKADRAFGELMHTLVTHCAINDKSCKGKLEAHHIISRSNVLTRHNPLNGIVLCSYHHKYSTELSPHAGPVGFSEWLRVNRPDKYEWVLRNKWHTGKPDYKASYEVLTQLIEGANEGK